jgi:hypothetical protein
MATEKQRRRRAKEKRHAYDLVEIDAEGNETVLTASELKTEATGKAGSGRKVGPAKGSGRVGRGTPQPPSWPRVAKRGAIFAPLFLATVMLLGGGKVTFAGALVNTVLLLAVFIPFSYLMDRVVWRMYQKRVAKGG